MATSNQGNQPAADESVASDKQNAKLEHSQGGATTRDDATDLGVPMLAGDPAERQGPEDALGAGPKRGDYRDRLGYGDTPGPHEGGVPQAPRVNERGDVEGAKGGVDT